MASDELAPLDILLAEAEIRRVVARYCRAIDRMDEQLLRSCYHPDAHDEHGSFSGSVDEYVAWVWPLLAKYDATMHLIGNQLVELRAPDVARVESYGVAVHRSASGHPELNLTTGFRFVDRFERRPDWRIAHRVAITEWSWRVAPEEWWPISDRLRQGARDRSDPVYWV